MLVRLFILIILAVGARLGAFATNAADTIVSIVNVYPGSDIYELEGHTLLRLQLPHYDVAISYGTYNFEQPNFVYRFVKGETDYWVTAIPWEAVKAAYTAEHRLMVEHTLDLNAPQKQHLLDLVSENLAPDNRTYRYNYVKDNCATRPLRIVELAAADSIMLPPAQAPFSGQQTFRSVMRTFHAHYPWYQFGIDLALGSGIDYTLNTRELTFAPVLMDKLLPDATVGGKKLVKESHPLNGYADYEAVLSPTPWYRTPFTVCTLICVLVIFFALHDLRRKKISRWLYTALYGSFGLTGCIIAFLVFISVHEATSPNLLLLWLNPLCLIPAILIWIKRCRIVVLSYQIVNFVALITLLVLASFGWQTLNAAFYPLILADLTLSASYIYLYYSKTKQTR